MIEEEDNIDHKFKEGLSNAEDNIAFRNADWDAMEKLLDEEKRRRGFIYRLPAIITGIAALLLLALGFFFLRPATNNDANKNNVARIKPSNSNSTNNNTIDKTSTSTNPSNGNTIENQTAIASTKPASGAANTAANNEVSANDSKNTATLSGAKSSTEIANASNNNSGNGNHSKSKNGLNSQQPGINNNNSQLAAISSRNHRKNTGNINDAIAGASTDNTEIAAVTNNKNIINTANKSRLNGKSPADLSASGTSVLNDNALQSLNIASLNATDKQLDKSSRSYAAAVIAKQRKKSSFNSFGPTHAVILSILTAPDFNGVGGSFSNTQVGSTSGLMLSVGLTHRLTISTGAMYAKKPYSANFSQYTTNYPFKVQPTNVYADCRVLDIPLNIDYRLYSKGRNLIAVGTGISSYFMLRENYRFDYGNNPGWASTNFDIKNQNQHILGVLNLSATYERRINEKFGLNVQPYMKLPLTSIGYGKVDLQSTGVAVGVSWYLSSNHPK